MTEAHARRGKFIVDPRVDRGIVVPAVAGGEGEEVESGHVLLPEDDGQPLVVQDVLVLRNGQSTSLLTVRRENNKYFVC